MREMQKGHDQFVSVVAKLGDKITSGWKHKVLWAGATDTSTEGLVTHVYPHGPGLKYWEWVSLGVLGHYIIVKKKTTFRGYKKYKPALKLNRYIPRTRPGGRLNPFGGVRLAPTVYRQPGIVWWTGIEPREFEKHMAPELLPEYRRLMENAARRGVRAAQREGH